MGRIPLPPGHKPVEHIKEAKKPEPRKGVGRDDVAWILKTTLEPEHREDPNVVGFIKAYCQCRDISQAAKTVGLNWQQGNAIKKRSDVHEAIAQITNLSILEYDYDAGEIIQKIKEIVNVDPADLLRPDGTYVESLTELTPETRRAIKYFRAKNTYEKDPNGMRVVTGCIIEVEFWDKLKSAELLGREKNIFKETKVHKHDITENMGNLLLESQKRAAAAMVEMQQPEREALPAPIDVTVVESSDE